MDSPTTECLLEAGRVPTESQYSGCDIRCLCCTSGLLLQGLQSCMPGSGLNRYLVCQISIPVRLPARWSSRKALMTSQSRHTCTEFEPVKPLFWSLPFSSRTISAWSSVVSPAHRIACLTKTPHRQQYFEGCLGNTQTHCNPSNDIHGPLLQTSIYRALHTSWWHASRQPILCFRI